jgi:hypothetical protein
VLLRRECGDLDRVGTVQGFVGHASSFRRGLHSRIASLRG